MDTASIKKISTSDRMQVLNQKIKTKIQIDAGLAWNLMKASKQEQRDRNRISIQSGSKKFHIPGTPALFGRTPKLIDL